jgi:hypothetical protein
MASKGEQLCSHAQYTMLLSGKDVMLQKKCDECWLCAIVYGNQYNLLIRTLRLPRPASACVMRVTVSHITMHSFKYTSVRLSPNVINANIPQCSEGISISITIHENHIRVLGISKSNSKLIVLPLLLLSV